MPFKSVYYNTRKNKIHLWEEIQGEIFYDEIDWTPYCFVDDPSGEIKTIYGTPTSKKYFKSYKDYMNFCKNNKKGVYENNVVPVIQFLAERYYNVPTEEMTPPALKIYSLDIEVHTTDVFPTVEKAEKPIVLISVTDMNNGKVVCFGEKQLTKELNYDLEYHYCENEESLLKIFLNWWSHNHPDVITGWNINADYKVNVIGGFDLPYIINRCKNLFGEDTNIYKNLSPLKIVSMFKKENTGSHVVDIAGVNIIDYLALYKWYTARNLEAYSLEVVCRYELDKGKVEYDNDLAWLYYNDWDKYVEYNIEDTYLIKELEDKLKYIKLAQSVSLLCKCPLRMYSSTTNLVEGLMLTRFRRNGKCAPFFAGGSQTSYPAAYVKEPLAGKYDWLFSLDIASSYPFAIITLNMSPETLYGKILDMPEQDIISCMENREFPEIKIDKNGEIKELEGKQLKTFNKAIQNKMISVAPNGVMFFNKPAGVYANMEGDIYNKRVELKNKMADKFKEYEKTGKIETKYEAENLFTSQWALKIVINGAYGVTAVPYSRYFSPYMAEAVTAVGRCSLRSGEYYTNNIFNNPTQEIKDILNEI